MGLKINKQIETTSGNTIDSLYIRIIALLDFHGDCINVTLLEYVSREAYKADKKPIENNFPSAFRFEYNRENDGGDVLKIAHDKLKQHLIDHFSILESEIESEL
jgi:hypothetical protein